MLPEEYKGKSEKMKKYQIINKITECGVVAVVRAKTTEQAVKISQACIDGGIRAIEVTFTVDYAHEVIKTLKESFNNSELTIGAGTVLDSETARIAILNGAEFIVSPNFNLEIAKLCNRYQLPYMPGCITISEIVTAMEAGCDIIKIFPGSLVGPSFIKAVKGPLPDVNLMPTGGVSLDNAATWIKNGCIALGVGGQLTAPAKTGDYQEVSRLAKKFVEIVKEARTANIQN